MPRWDLETLGKRVLRLARGAAARHLELVPPAADVRRGERFEVTLGVDPKKAERRLEVGLLCTETYHSYVPQADVSRSDDLTIDETAFEQWVPVDGGAGRSTVSLTVPSDAPFSYDGEHLKFTWRVGVRQPGARGVDPLRTQEIRVLP